MTRKFLRPETHPKKIAHSQNMPIPASNDTFLARKRTYFYPKKYFLRFSIILNSQTIYYTYITNKKRNKNFHVIYTLNNNQILARANETKKKNIKFLHLGKPH